MFLMYIVCIVFIVFINLKYSVLEYICIKSSFQIGVVVNHVLRSTTREKNALTPPNDVHTQLGIPKSSISSISSTFFFPNHPPNNQPTKDVAI